MLKCVVIAILAATHKVSMLPAGPFCQSFTKPDNMHSMQNKAELSSNAAHVLPQRPALTSPCSVTRPTSCPSSSTGKKVTFRGGLSISCRYQALLCHF